jgi:hypothetical protein
MSDDLVKRLRDFNHDLLIEQAADRIEQLAATCEELEAKLEKARTAIYKIAPYLSASLESPHCGPEYIEACNMVFEADYLTLAELKGETE